MLPQEFANPTDSDISLDDYAFPSTSNSPDTPGEYEYWYARARLKDLIACSTSINC